LPATEANLRESAFWGGMSALLVVTTLRLLVLAASGIESPYVAQGVLYAGAFLRFLLVLLLFSLALAIGKLSPTPFFAGFFLVYFANFVIWQLIDLRHGRELPR